MRKINVVIIAVFFLIVGFGFAWADIDVENVLNFTLDPVQDDIILFNPPGALKPYSLGINSAGDFIIEQNNIVKFRITSSGDVYIVGNVKGNISWDELVNEPGDCAGGYYVTEMGGSNLICEE